METKTYRQFGTFSVIVMLPIVLVFIVLMINSGISADPVTIIQLFVIVTLLICLLIFYQLKIKINSQSISFRLGIGLLGKTYKITEIKSCKAVTNSAINGIGIRMLSNGWLYSVSGLKAIELQFINRKSVVRIGTDKPEELAQLISTLINKECISDNEILQEKRLFNPMWMVAILLFLLPITLLISGKEETKIVTSHNGLTIGGLYGLSITFNDMIKVDTVSVLPQVRLRTNGYALGKARIGNFRLTDGSNVKLFVKNGFPPYILIHSKNNKPIYINYQNRHKTIDLFNNLTKDKN